MCSVVSELSRMNTNGILVTIWKDCITERENIMGDIIEWQKPDNISVDEKNEEIINESESLLAEARIDLSKQQVISMPIAEIGTLGAGVSTLIPALRTITETVSVNGGGYYKLANAGLGDALKLAKDGTFWGAIKTVDGESKMGKFIAADSMEVVSKAVMPVNPAYMMMAVALFSIEQQLTHIEDTTQKIITHLEIKEKAEIEANIETLCSILKKYKFNWDNEHFVASNHKLALDIQKEARKHMLIYSKEIDDYIHPKKKRVLQPNAKQLYSMLLEKIKYYRLALHTYAMSSYIEILLSGNFKKENIQSIKNEIESFTLKYHEIFDQCSVLLEKTARSAADLNLLKHLGEAGQNAGKAIGKIPVINKGPVDEFLLDKGKDLSKNVRNKQNETIKGFSAFHDPETRVFTEQMRKLIPIYNNTEDIYIDDKYIYLVAE